MTIKSARKARSKISTYIEYSLCYLVAHLAIVTKHKHSLHAQDAPAILQEPQEYKTAQLLTKKNYF